MGRRFRVPPRLTGLSSDPRRSGAEDLEAARIGRAAVVPMERYGRREEVAHVMACLSSDDASYRTGTIFLVRGGLNA